MKRRTFLELTGLGLANTLTPRTLAAQAASQSSPVKEDLDQSTMETYGSGHFGRWERDSHELPTYRYTCNQLTDPLAVLPVHKEWQSPTNHIHQVGNDRLVAVASNYGHVQVRQDEGSPKFLNDYCPEEHRYGGGIGFLSDGKELVLSTYFTGKAKSFDRFLGMGYLRKTVSAGEYTVDQVVFAPYGDDPVMVSQVTVTNRSNQTVQPRWVEYWGCSNYQFSYRSLMESGVLGTSTSAVERRRELSARFTHHFRAMKDGKGLVETQAFLGRTQQDEQTWQQTQDSLTAKPTGFFGGPTPPLPTGTSMEDLAPPSTFLASLDAPADDYATDARRFFSGGIDHPDGAVHPLGNDLRAQGPESAFLVERRLELRPGESRTLYFLYGYLPQGFTLDALVKKYAADPTTLWARSSAQWKPDAPLFHVPTHPWVERETLWSIYYVRSGLTYDNFFREHILSQGAGYQYQAGLQGAARDPLQHVLPLIFTDPQIVRQVLCYTLKEIQPDGSIPYAIVGNGVPMPCVYRPSDLQLWVLWVASEYVLATRDHDFLRERVPVYPRRQVLPDDPTVLDLLSQCFTHITTAIGTGKHGLLKIFNGDWNDSIVYTHLTPEQREQVFPIGESVLNAAMAAYVFDHYARMLDFIDHRKLADQSRAKATEQREAVQAQWHQQWYRRAWLSEELGWVGEKQMWLSPQPWALIGNCVPPERIGTLVTTLNDLARKPSPIGALLQSQPDPTMKDEPGTGTNGGIFAAINGTLVWALALVNGEMAWDEWQKNTLARHAQTYPDMWFGIWSGPDCYHSVLSSWPGGTGVDFPVLNMHSHAWPLYSAIKLLGTEFHGDGVRFKPGLPLEEYECNTPLLGFKKTPKGYSGWYSPTQRGSWRIEVELPDVELTRLNHLSVNGMQQALHHDQGRIAFRGNSAPGAPLRWQVSFR
jgi:hypothetical protein